MSIIENKKIIFRNNETTFAHNHFPKESGSGKGFVKLLKKHHYIWVLLGLYLFD